MEAMLGVSGDGIRDWFTAIGTFGAVLAALFIAWWQERRREGRRPDLFLTYDPDESFLSEGVYYPGDGRAYHGDYFRLVVGNRRSKDAAVDVEVLMSSLEDLGKSSDRSTRIAFPGFTWTHTASTRLTLPPGVRRFIDIGCVHHNSPREYRSIYQGRFELQVSPPPANLRHLLVPGEYRIGFTVSSHNADARHYSLTIRFNAPNIVGDHRRVQVLSLIENRPAEEPIFIRGVRGKEA